MPTLLEENLENQKIKLDKKSETIKDQIDQLVEKAKNAQEKFKSYTQEQIDEIVKAMALAGIENHILLAKLAYEETKMGIYEDKITKNLFSVEYIYNYIKDKKTVGTLNIDPQENYFEVAEPIGIIAGVTPVTNPTSTTMFKCLISIKTKNPIIFSFHPKALNCSTKAAQIMYEAAIKAGAPEDCIAYIKQPSIEATNLLMTHPDISLILATGGAGMVKSAYSSGKPALGVGPGNVPCYIEKSANIKRAVSDLILSKTFDNGTVCASEQAVIIDYEIADEVKKLLKEFNCYFLNKDEIKKLENFAIDKNTNSMNPSVVGQSASKIAKMAGFEVLDNTKILIAEYQDIGPEFPLSREKLSPILSLYTVKNYKEGIEKCEKMIQFGGMGHSAVIHSENREIIKEFSENVPAGRIIVNAPSSQGAIGDIYNTQTPSLTLGCGTMGGNSTTDNVNIYNLINIKRVLIRKERLKWLILPPQIYFERGSLQVLSQINSTKAFIVTDPVMLKLGFVDKAIYHLDKKGIKYEIFSDVEPDPSVETVEKGVKIMKKFEPDTIIAIGGGSPIDAAKGMWLFYEHDNIKFDNLKLKFMDIRKRTYKFPDLGKKATFIAIPTTSGTGSEVTAFAVITDKKKNIKYPLADYELTPDIAIIDPDLTATIPPSVTADTGLDALTHAIEAYVSVMASDYTDALAEKAIKLIFENLEEAYKNGNNKIAREKMHNASCIAGMAFTNAFLGINHSMAHILGAKFHIPHGRANAVLLPYVIEYNAALPNKLAAFPQYEYPIAAEKYSYIARLLGLQASTKEEGVKNLTKAIQDLMKKLNMPLTLKEMGVQKSQFEKELFEMADIALNDQCTGSNPRMPLISEIIEIYKKAYGQNFS